VVAATDEKGTNYTKGMTTKRRTPMRASDTIYLATGIRRPTVDELAILQTFPEAARFAGSVHQQYVQVGNAVPVVLARALGLALREMIH
jgi:DNA (cytosine-5)-methyltransferase 1